MSRAAQGTAGERALLEPGAHTSLQGLGIWADSAHPTGANAPVLVVRVTFAPSFTEQLLQSEPMTVTGPERDTLTSVLR